MADHGDALSGVPVPAPVPACAVLFKRCDHWRRRHRRAADLDSMDGHARRRHFRHGAGTGRLCRGHGDSRRHDRLDGDRPRHHLR